LTLPASARADQSSCTSEVSSGPFVAVMLLTRAGGVRSSIVTKFVLGPFRRSLGRSSSLSTANSQLVTTPSAAFVKMPLVTLFTMMVAVRLSQ
jgi:hypothetical protein